jgi:anaerobic ribonucleoside-triphosphate reductase activating protein
VGNKVGEPNSLILGGIESESIVDGPGFRYVIFVQGCCFSCPGCHNSHLQSFKGGRRFFIEEILEAIKDNPLLDGITLSGGEPFTQAAACAVLAEQVRDLGLSVVTFSGYRWEDLVAGERDDWDRLLETTNILVDGPFVQESRNIDLRFRGSSNQRLIHVPASILSGKTVVLPDDFSADIMAYEITVPYLLRSLRNSVRGNAPERAYSSGSVLV